MAQFFSAGPTLDILEVLTDDVQLPSYLVYRSDLRTVICSQHGSSYVRSELDRHMREAHGLSHQKRQAILRTVEAAGLASKIDEIPRPKDGGPPIEGLPVYRAFRCNTDINPTCRYITRDKSTIDKHYRALHEVDILRKGGADTEEDGYSDWHTAVYVQNLFRDRKDMDYFVVEPWAKLRTQGWTNKSALVRQEEPQENAAYGVPFTASANHAWGFAAANDRRLTQPFAHVGHTHVGHQIL